MEARVAFPLEARELVAFWNSCFESCWTAYGVRELWTRRRTRTLSFWQRMHLRRSSLSMWIDVHWWPESSYWKRRGYTRRYCLRCFRDFVHRGTRVDDGVGVSTAKGSAVGVRNHGRAQMLHCWNSGAKPLFDDPRRCSPRRLRSLDRCDLRCRCYDLRMRHLLRCDQREVGRKT